MVGRVIWIQVLLTVLAGAVGSMRDVVTGYSAALGGLVALAGTVYFARRVFARSALASASRLAGTVYRAETAKLALTGVLFAGLFAAVRPLDLGALFLAFGIVYVSASLGLLCAPPTLETTPARTDP